ncbi:MAG: RIP metalloprotease RseP [Clostridia bacterium]|nr:RIP metalloprotease RseP [Clostridia bacterium]
MITILIALLVFGVLIFIHELGHFIAARSFDVAVREFALGMGPRLISHRSKKTGIVYSLRLLPIGGFVSMVGEDEDSDDECAFCRKAVWKRMIITAAGAFMNLLLGVILMSALVAANDTLGSTTILRFNSANALSEESGLRIGDTIKKIDGERMHISTELVYTLMRVTTPVNVEVERAGNKVIIEDVVFPTDVTEGTLFGYADFKVEAVDKTPLTVIRHAFYQSIASVKMIWHSFIDLITGKYGVEQMSGPVGVTTAIGEAAEQGSTNLIFLCALISLNLGIFNLLPLPALDGGRLVFQVIELFRRKPINPEYEGFVHFVGIVLLMLLMIFITYKDITKIFIK